MTIQRMSVPLHKAVLYRHFDVGRLLVDRGAELDAVTDDTNETPLHYAAKNGDYRMVEYLINRGANDTIRDNDGYRARDVALACNHTRVAELLTRHLQLEQETGNSDRFTT
jgi:ankyrin repeat protein